MASQRDTVFPLIPAPMALAVDTLSAATTGTSRQPPVPSKPSTTTAAPPGPAWHSSFNEDIFSRFYTTPFMVPHFALYGAVPLYYMLHYSPFRAFEAGGGTLGHITKWALFMLTQYATAIIVTSWDGRYQVHKDVAACALMLAGVAVATWLRLVLGGTAPVPGR